MTAKFFRVFGFALAICALLLPVLFPASIYGRSSRLQKSRDPEVRKANIAFEENLGQFDPRVIFAGKGNGQTVFLTADEAAFVMPMPQAKPATGDISLRAAAETREVYALKMKFSGASSKSQMAAEGELDGKFNYFKGSDPSKWATDVSRFAKVINKGVYDGIDIAWYGREDGRIEYDLIIAPNADSSRIKLEFDGADAISVDKTGDLVIATPAGEVRHGKPVVYQEINDTKQPVEGAYEISGGKVGFSLGDYDRSKPLVIDPIPNPPITYSTYLGGTGQDWPRDVEADSAGNAYVAGYTYSTDYPITSGTNPADRDIFVTKLNNNGTGMIYSVLIGGSESDAAYSIALDPSGNAFLTGITSSSNFPVSFFANDKVYNGGGDAFITKLNSAGSMSYSTYVGGNDTESGNAIAIDSDGSAYITGKTESANFPTTAGAYDQTLGGNQDVFVTKVSSAGITLLYSTYIGGSGSSEIANSLAVDSLGRAYVAGMAHAGSFPVTAGSFSTVHSTTLPDCFVTKFNSAGSALVYSAMIGGDRQDEAKSIAIDSSGNAYITGGTSSDNYPVSFAAFDQSYGSTLSAGFVTKVNSAGSSLSYSTYLAGDDGISSGIALALNSSGKVIVAGRTSSTTFPTFGAASDTTSNGGTDLFIIVLTTSAFSTVNTSTYFGGTSNDEVFGIGINGMDDAYLTGYTQSADFPATPSAFDTTPNGDLDGFATRYYHYWLF